MSHRGVASQLALGPGLLLLAGATEYRIETTYLPKVRTVWQNFEGMREIAPILAALPGRERGIVMAFPYPRQLITDLHFRMLMPEGVEWPRPADFTRALAAPRPGVRFGALAYADDPEWRAPFLDWGFSRVAELRGGVSGRELWLLLREPGSP